MPTAARLVGAILFAGIGYACALLYYPALPEGTQATYFAPFCMGLGLIAGWRIMGDLVGGTLWVSSMQGARTALTMFFWALVLFSIREMIIRSTRFHFGDVVEALVSTVGIMWEFTLLSLVPQFWVTLLIGGGLAGLIVELANRRWR